MCGGGERRTYRFILGPEMIFLTRGQTMSACLTTDGEMSRGVIKKMGMIIGNY